MHFLSEVLVYTDLWQTAISFGSYFMYEPSSYL